VVDIVNDNKSETVGQARLTEYVTGNPVVTQEQPLQEGME
jgi:hypothetical protein